MKSPRNLQYKWMPDRAAPEFYEEFTLYTLVHAGIGPGDPTVDALLDRALQKELKKTYHVACMAMALEAIDKQAYQKRIAQCAQFLVDNQLEDGGWGYGDPTNLPPITVSEPKKKPVVTSSGSGSGSSPAKPSDKKGTIALPKIGLRRQRWGKPPHDNSNTQIAILGLRAAILSGVQLPPDTLPLAAKYLRGCGQGGGWGYRKEEGGAWGSMTAGAVSSLAICDFYGGGVSAKNDPDIVKGVDWMVKRWTWDKCPDQPRGEWQYYYIYGVERVGRLVGVDVMGGHDWYAEGVKYLLSKQRGDGSWEGGNSDVIVDTCFAILFLRRATKPLQKVFTQ
jgi:hypothetical protein